MREQIEFASSEKEFIHNYGVNKGYTMAYTKINRCYFISSEAKQLYTNIGEYAYHGKRECFPGQESLRQELGWSKPTLSNYLNELRVTGLVTTKHQNFGGTLVYTLHEIHKIPVLVHSEMVHSIREGCGTETDFYKALELYKKSGLCTTVSNSPDPTMFRDEVGEWFKEALETVPELQNAPLEPPKVSKPASHGFNTWSRNGEVSVSSEGNQKPKKKSADPNDVGVADWNQHHFVKYFETGFQTKFGKPYIITETDRRSFSTLIKKLGDQWNKQSMKNDIDNFISMDIFKTKTIRAFCSSYTQTTMAQAEEDSESPMMKQLKELFS